jgi:Flp pilus assembly protein CpaB
MKTFKMLAIAAVLALGAGYGFAAELAVPPGYRAVVVPVEKAELAFIKPGSRLDMTVTFSALLKDDRKELVTATILQNLLVLATLDKGGTRALVLALNPNEAQYANLSMAEGYRINFIIRNPGDRELHPMEIASFRRLIRGDKEEEKAEEKAAPAKAP